VSDVLVVGCGLMGASVGLALQGAGVDVTLQDASPEALAGAQERGAGRAWDGREGAALAVVAVPPRATAAALIELLRMGVAKTYSHVASVQAQVQREVEASGSDVSRLVGGHPLAGRELSGPGAATADLFVGRPWAICPSPRSETSAVEAVTGLAARCGAVPVEVEPDVHDRAVALLSHLPQVLSSALAATLHATVTASHEPVDPMRLSGPGLVDTTRLAAGNVDLWTDILTANAAEVGPLVRQVATRLAGLADALDPSAAGGAASVREVEALLRAGNAGRALVPVKRGEAAAAFSAVRVELEDRPGELARVLLAAGEAGINVEDLRVEHVPGQPRGVVELAVVQAQAASAVAALTSAGWRVWMSIQRLP
jgi:prephenate dehydrogenase